MQMVGTEAGDLVARKQVRDYFREVSEHCKLPPLPGVVATALRLIRDPDVDSRKLARTLSDDAALVGRIFHISRSAIYGRYEAPKTLQQALQVLGLRTVQRVLVAATAQALCQDRSEISEKLWLHALATALAAEKLAKQAGARELDQAFLGGLLHDIGKMVLLHGGPAGFKKMVQQAEGRDKPLMQWEKDVYGFDHTLIGVVLLDCWDFDAEVGKGLLHHHDDAAVTLEPGSLGALLQTADYLANLAGFGFISPPQPPAAGVLEQWGCDNEEDRVTLVEQLRQAVDAEKALYV
jgi:putative nucleotidyltransferase with HDIG domain